MRAFLARAGVTALPAAWFTALALAVAGPLLAFSGYLLLLDWPSGPQFPRVDFFPDASSGAIGNTAPLDALHAGLRAVNQYLPDKLFLIAPILLGGFGVYRLVRSRLGVGAWGGILGGTLFVVNPWVTDRYLSGHLHILLAYTLLPWAALPLFDAVREPSLGRALLAGGWLFGLGVIDLHVAGMYALLAVVCLLAAPTRRRVLYAGAALGIAALLSAWWLIPVLLSPPGIRVGAADLSVYASRPRSYEVLPTLAAMYGFWRNEFAGPAARIPGLYLLLIPILGLVGLGMGRLTAPGPARRFAVVLAVIAVVALLLAAGTSFPPSAGIFRWVYDHVYAFRIYREPQKFLAMVVLAYAVFAAAGLDGLIAGRARWLATVVAGVSVAAVISYGYTLFWGIWDQVHLSHYPRDWYLADRIMEERGREGKLLVLPWELYAVWSFSDGRIVATPAPSFFQRDVLHSESSGLKSAGFETADHAQITMTNLFSNRVRGRTLGARLAPFDIRYVLLIGSGHWKAMLADQRDLSPLGVGTEIGFWQNLTWNRSGR